MGAKGVPREFRYGQPDSNWTDACAGDYDPAFDYFPDKVAPQQASYFEVSYHGNYKIVRVRLPASSGRAISSDTMVLLQCGTPAPPLEGEIEGATLIEIPAMKAAANEDGNVTSMVELGFEDRIVAMGGGGVYYEPLRRRHEAGEIVSIGYSFHQKANIEPLAAIRPDAIFLLVPSLEWASGFDRMRSLGLNAVPTFAVYEPTFLGNAEWIKFSSMFFNAEAKANQIFQTVVDRCQRWTATVEKEGRPLTVWAEMAEPGFWSVHHNSRESEFLRASGASLVWNSLGEERVSRLSDEAFLDLAGEADYWITGDQTDERWNPAVAKRIRAYRTGRVYHHHKRAVPEAAAYDWYETPVVRPDLVLQDLVSILHPKLAPDHEPLFFTPFPLDSKP